jgi:S1-C subfamily serine protease
VIGAERVVTTSHSVEWDEGVTVRTADGRSLAAEVAGHAAGADVVLLRVAGLDAPVLPRATDGLRTADIVLVAGRAWSGNPHVRLLAVSGVGGPLRAADGTRIEQVYGLPVPPYPGVSGSALVNANGRLAGLATAGIVRGRVLGLPSSALSPLVDTLETRGTVGRGFLGVTTHPVRLTPAQASAAGQEGGLVILGVSVESPAAAALLVGDVLLSADGAALATAEDLLAALGPERVGQALSLRVLRGGGSIDATVTVGARPSRW